MGDGKKSVFISHSSEDERAVMLVCQALERNDIGCWVSSRDIPPKADWAVEITRGLEETKLVVLVLSENSVKSNEVLKELTLASQMKMPHVIFRIDKVKPNRGFMFHLSIEQWVPAANPPNDRQLQTLVGVVDRCLLDLKRTWWRPDPDGFWYRGGRKRTLPLLGLAIAAIAALGIFGVPYLRDLVIGDPADVTARRQMTQDASGADSLAAAERDTAGTPSDVTAITGQSSPILADTRGTVTLTTHPSGASVYLDGDHVGATPLRDHELEAGSYTASFRLAGYRSETRDVEVRAGGGSVVDVTLSRALTALEVTSIPSSAEVVLDGSRLGTTPCTFDRLTGGDHVVVVSKDGYATRRDTLALRVDRPYLHEARLERLVGHLTVTIVPSGSIAINGDPKAEDSNAPYTTALRPGTYEVEARHVIYGVWRKTVEIANGDEKNLVFDFTQEFDLTVTSNPSNATIYVNDRFRGCYTPYMISVRPGLRRIDVRLAGYHTLGARELMVEEGVGTFIHFDMQRTP
ncbi:PEGA domain-containing protein [bacterium]|nr:PEGA domain-containing protein [bacterium]MBU1073697.1 PEGA domain-containing protein [bacterium]MBU1675297.1 PEGA domain-containing protein [bacterium]